MEWVRIHTYMLVGWLLIIDLSSCLQKTKVKVRDAEYGVVCETLGVNVGERSLCVAEMQCCTNETLIRSIKGRTPIFSSWLTRVPSEKIATQRDVQI
jgi:hypothetical protein